MLVVIGSKKIKILFYLFAFIFLSTISFFEKSKIFGNKVFFKLENIEIHGNQKINSMLIKKELSDFKGKNLLFINSDDIQKIIDKNKLVKEYKIQKKYPNTIYIILKEVNFVGKIIKDMKKYYLADNNNLVLFNDSLNGKDLPNIYGKDAEYYFNDFKELLELNNFKLEDISSYFFFQVNRWDLVLNDGKTLKFPSKNLEDAIKIANRLLINKNFNKYSVIDLRINDKIITE